jgi:hypothetical protein
VTIDRLFSVAKCSHGEMTFFTMYQYPLFPLIVNHTHTSTVLVLVTCLLQVLAYELAHRAPHVRADKGCCYVLYVVVWTVAVAAAVAVAVAVAVALAVAVRFIPEPPPPGLLLHFFSSQVRRSPMLPSRRAARSDQTRPPAHPQRHYRDMDHNRRSSGKAEGGSELRRPHRPAPSAVPAPRRDNEGQGRLRKKDRALEGDDSCRLTAHPLAVRIM